MVEEEVGNAAVEDDDLDVGIVVELADDLVEAVDGLSDDQVDRRVREGDLRDLRCRTFEGDGALWVMVRSVLLSLKGLQRSRNSSATGTNLSWYWKMPPWPESG